MGMSDERRRNAAFFDSAILSNRAGGGALPLSVSFLFSQPIKIHQIMSRFLLME